MKQANNLTQEVKTYAQEVREALPERLLKGDKPRRSKTSRRKRRIDLDLIEASYNQLDGLRPFVEIAYHVGAGR